MLTPLPAATPMKPGSAVSTSALLPRGREGSQGHDKAVAGTVCTMAWWLPACQGAHGMVVHAGRCPPPKFSCATASWKLPLLCPLLPVPPGGLIAELTSLSPCSLVPMADVALLRCGPCHPERVGGRAGRRSRRLPGKEGLRSSPTLPLLIPHQLQHLPGSLHTSLLTLAPHKGPPWVVGAPFPACFML